MSREHFITCFSTYDADGEVWPITPANFHEAPHAPWFRRDQDVLDPLDFPRPEILGYLLGYASLVPHDLLDRLITSTISRLDNLSDTMDQNNLRRYLPLAESSSLPAHLRARVIDTIGPIAERVVSRDPQDWRTYCLKPLDIVASPDSPFAATLAAEIEANLDFELGQQQTGCSWAPTWTWGEDYPDAWEEAKREWKGMITVDMLRSMRSFGRLE